PPDPLLRGADSLVAEAGPDFAVALAVERRLGQNAADVADEFLIGARALRATPLGFESLRGGGALPVALGVDRRAARAPGAPDASKAVLPPRRGGCGPPYFFRLLGTKGWSARHRWSSSSLSMVSSPTLARSRAISSSRSSVGRLFRAAWPPARKSSRQPARVAAVTPSSRARSSRLSPRRRRRTVAALRGAEKRPRSPGFGVLAMGVGSWGLDTDDVPIGCPTEPRGGGRGLLLTRSERR